MFRGRGCRHCSNTGYKGRIALIETLVVTPGIRRLIAEKVEEHRIREAARKEGMDTILELKSPKIV